MASFDDATRVVATADGHFTAELDPEWTVGGKPHGGYLLAVLGRAVVALTPAHPHPISASAVYASSPSVGPAAVSVEVIRPGRLASQVRARLTQEGKVLVEALFVTGRLDSAAAEHFIGAPPAQVPPFEACQRTPVQPMGEGFRLPMLALVEQRVDPATYRNADGDLRGWLGFADGTPFDPISLLYAADSFPPPTLTLGSVGWVPTLELTTYLRAIPAPGPLRMRQYARAVSGGLVDIVCEAWDSLGRVVIQATQIAAVRMPVPPVE